MMDRYHQLRRWANVAARACPRCSHRLAFAVCDRELGEPPAAVIPCDHPEACRERILAFWPSRPLPGERFHGLDTTACGDHRAIVVLVGDRRVKVCATCAKRSEP
jgi:hypothetical protein